MKQLIIFLLCICSVIANSQTPVTGKWRYYFMRVDSNFTPPQDTLASAPVGSTAVKNDVNYYKLSTGVWVPSAYSVGQFNLPVSHKRYDASIVLSPSGSVKQRNVLVDSATAWECIKNWNTQNVPINRIWTNLDWSPELKLLVVTSHQGTADGIMTSPDGVNWTARATPTNAWRSVAWSPKLHIFAAVSSTGTLNNAMTSPDGINWTARVTPNSYYYRDMTWVDELGLFIAVANTASVTDKVITSPDGINWTARTCPDRAWSDIVWSPELKLLCVSATGAIDGDKVMTSPDGITWTLRVTPFGSSPGNTASWEGIGWSRDLKLFSAVAYSGDSVSGKRVMTSPDGINWTLRSAPNQQWLSVDWSPRLGLWAAVCDDLSTGFNVMTSPDGITWTLVGNIINRDWRRIKWFDDLGSFVAVAYYDGSTAGDSLIMLSRPIDVNQQYLNLRGRDTSQTINGNIKLFGTPNTPIFSIKLPPGNASNPIIRIVDSTNAPVFDINTNSIFNIFMGVNVGIKNIKPANQFANGGSNIGIGGPGNSNLSPLQNNTIGNENIAIGGAALGNNISGNANVAIGLNSLLSHRVNGSNVSIGQASMAFDTSGIENISIGFNTLRNNLNAIENVGVGGHVLWNNATGNGNTAVGTRALGAATSQSMIVNYSANTGIGWNAGWLATMGNQNTLLGYSVGAGSTMGNDNILIGSFQSVTGSINNTTLIGDSVSASISNVAVIGKANQNVIVGVTSVTTDNGAKLQVAGNQSLGVVVTGTTAALGSTATEYVFTGTTATWTLPVVSTTTGWYYFIKNRGSGNLTINSNAGGNDIYSTSAVNTVTVAANGSLVLFCDGTFWNTH